MDIDLDQVQKMMAENAVEYGLNILGALAVYFLGKWICRGLQGLITKLMLKSKVEKTVVDFAANIFYWIAYLFVIIASLGQLGVETGSFIAIFGAAGLAVGLALQGSLSNFASGVIIMLFRPFKVGNYVEAGGVGGTVTEIQIFNTILTTPDNKRIFVPNSQITGDSIINYSANSTRRVEVTFGVSYGDNIDEVRKMILEIIEKDARILKDPAPTVAIASLGDNSVNFVIRPWVKTDDFWGVFFDLQEKLKKSADEKGISIPFPQRDVHIYNETPSKD